MKKGAIDNTRKNINRGKAVATFCMGRRATYDYIHDNPAVEFRTIDYTNDPSSSPSTTTWWPSTAPSR